MTEGCLPRAQGLQRGKPQQWEVCTRPRRAAPAHHSERLSKATETQGNHKKEKSPIKLYYKKPHQFINSQFPWVWSPGTVDSSAQGPPGCSQHASLGRHLTWGSQPSSRFTSSGTSLHCRAGLRSLPCQHFDFSAVKLILDFWPPKL